MKNSEKERRANVLKKLEKQEIREIRDLDAYKLSICHPASAGIDIGSREIWVAINPEIAAEMGEEIVRPFKTYTEGLEACRDWLLYCGIKDVSMESTGVYWKNIYDILDEAGLNVCLVNPRKFRMVEGRKTDILDCQWLQTLHMYGLLSGSFIPDADIRELRCYMRERRNILDDRSTCVLRMQKALIEMNLLLRNAVRDICGKTGMAIIEAILAGVRSGAVLATLRDPRCAKSEEEIAKELQGNYKEEQLYILKSYYKSYKFHTARLEELDARIAKLLDEFPTKPSKESTQETETENGAPSEKPAKKRTKRSKNALLVENLDERLCDINGVDLTTIPGFQASTVLQIVAEVGTDMTKFHDAKHFASYLGFVPHNKITGGVIISSRTDRIKSPAAQAFRNVVPSISRGKSALAAFYHRIAARSGVGKATVATCRKLAMTYYNAMVYGQPYIDEGAVRYKEKQKERELQMLKKLAKKHHRVLLPAS